MDAILRSGGDGSAPPAEPSRTTGIRELAAQVSESHGPVDTAMQEYVRGQDPDQVRGGLVERFQPMHSDGHLVTPDASAKSLVARMAGSETGSVRSYEHSAPDDPGRP